MARKEHPRYENTIWEDYEFREFPMMIYPGSKDGGKTPDRDPTKPGKFLQTPVTVANQAEFEAVMGLATTEAEAPKPAAAAAPAKAAKLVPASGGTQRLETEEDQRAELLEQAKVRGLQVDATWSVARIQDAIDTHDAAKRGGAGKDVV